MSLRNGQCDHADFIGFHPNLTGREAIEAAWRRCDRPAKHKSWRQRSTPDIEARWLCWHHWYREYLDSSHWESLRERKLSIGGRQCERCGRRAHLTAKGNWAGLQVHHRTYDTLGDESLDDLEVLCSQCHESHHGIAVQ